MNRLACQYAIIRFLPYAETGEFANVGVVLACPATNYLDARLMPTKNTRRIASFFDPLDKRIFRDALNYLGVELDRIREMVRERSDRGAVSIVQQTFEGLARPREALLRFSDARVVLAEDPDVMLDKLFARFVGRDFASKEYQDKILERDVRQVLARANLREYFRQEIIGTEELHVQVPFVHLHDGQPTHAIKPLDLAKDEPNQVYDHGGHWVDRIRRLHKHHLLPAEMLFAVQEPRESDTKTRDAANEIMTHLRDIGIRVTVASDVKAITDFAKSASLH
jgi:hypothetical protein